MFRFIHILLLNAWRGMRRANGTPAILITLIAVCVLFVGGNASARSSIQNVMHIVGLPVDAPAQPAEQVSDNTASKDSASQPDSNKKSGDTSKHDNTSGTSVTGKDQENTGQESALASEASGASVSLIPTDVTPVCQQGVMLYNVNAAQLSFAQPVSGNGGVTWSWETRIDSGTNAGSAPISNASHTVAVTSGQSVIPIIPDASSPTFLIAAANTNYAYSFRLDITSPFTVNTPWVSVPQASSATCQ